MASFTDILPELAEAGAMIVLPSDSVFVVDGAEFLIFDEVSCESSAVRTSEDEVPSMEEELICFKLVDWDEVLRRSHASTLPRLVELWMLVRNEPSNLQRWVKLLRYVEQEDDMEAARLAFDTFLTMYPYCDLYWKNYAEYEKRRSNMKEFEVVLERGLVSIPLSVDLQLYYLKYCMSKWKDDELTLRLKFEKSIHECGLEFGSDNIWLTYLTWEMENERYKHCLQIYDRMFQTPLRRLKEHFETFKDFVRTQRPSDILSTEECVSIRSMALGQLVVENVSYSMSQIIWSDDDVIASMREYIIYTRFQMYSATQIKVNDRWDFESSIKRPFFHVKPLEKSDLDNWNKYLDFEISSGDYRRIITLFERAAIACALHEKFWLKFVKYLDICDVEAAAIRTVYQRACLVHLTDKPEIAYAWASFEEFQGNLSVARQIHANTDARANNLLSVQLRRVNFERRHGNLETAANLFKRYIASSNQQSVTLTLISKYAQFCLHSLKNPTKAIEILNAAIEKYPAESSLYNQLENVIRSTPTDFDQRCVDVANSVLANDSHSLETKLRIAQMKFEYLQDFGEDVREIIDAEEHYEKYRKMQSERQ